MTFKYATAQSWGKHKSFSHLMVAECKKMDMRPVCEHPSYCRNDKAALYIGQYYHLSISPYRNILGC